jgi:predicted amidohydrolase YtcJ
MEVLKMWTGNDAYLTCAEKQKDSIERGRPAGLVVITKNYATCPEDEI